MKESCEEPCRECGHCPDDPIYPLKDDMPDIIQKETKSIHYVPYFEYLTTTVILAVLIITLCFGIDVMRSKINSLEKRIDTLENQE